MAFTAEDLRYRATQTYSALYTHLSRQAKRFLGSLEYDAFELEVVVGHVVEQLVRLGLLGGEDKTPLTALDHLSNAQFYTFLNRSIRNKAIDRLRKRRLQVSSIAELASPDDMEGEADPLNEVVAPIWGAPPFEIPEEAALAAASLQHLRAMLKHCLTSLCAAPHQLQAMIQELEEFGATELLQSVLAELHDLSLTADASIPHASQHKDHAHKKLRHCLQQQSTHLTVRVALRLTECGVHFTSVQDFLVTIQTLAQNDLSERDVRIGLKELTTAGVLHWQGEETVHCTSSQVKHLMRFYRNE